MKAFINGIRVFDHMMVSEYCRCWNRYFFKHVMGLMSPEYQEALAFGIMMHEALAVWYNTGTVEKAKKAFQASADKLAYVENTVEFQAKSSPRTVENGLDIIELYCSIFKEDHFKPTATEVEHFVPMIALHKLGNFVSKRNPGRSCGQTIGTNVYYGTHIDTVGHMGAGNRCFMEHKTTSLWSGSPGLVGYTFSLQVLGYAMAVQHKYQLPEACPGLLDFIYLRGKKREDITARFPLNFSPEQMNAFTENLSYTIGEILWREKELGPWQVPTMERCCAWNRYCEYAPVCSMLPDIDAAKNQLETFRFIETPHPRIETIKKAKIMLLPNYVIKKLEK